MYINNSDQKFSFIRWLLHLSCEKGFYVFDFLDTNITWPCLIWGESDIMSMTKLSGDGVICWAQTTDVYGNKYRNRIKKEWDNIKSLKN